MAHTRIRNSRQLIQLFPTLTINIINMAIFLTVGLKNHKFTPDVLEYTYQSIFKISLQEDIRKALEKAGEAYTQDDLNQIANVFFQFVFSMKFEVWRPIISDIYRNAYHNAHDNRSELIRAEFRKRIEIYCQLSKYYDFKKWVGWDRIFFEKPCTVICLDWGLDFLNDEYKSIKIAMLLLLMKITIHLFDERGTFVRWESRLNEFQVIFLILYFVERILLPRSQFPSIQFDALKHIDDALLNSELVGMLAELFKSYSITHHHRQKQLKKHLKQENNNYTGAGPGPAIQNAKNESAVTITPTPQAQDSEKKEEEAAAAATPKSKRNNVAVEPLLVGNGSQYFFRHKIHPKFNRISVFSFNTDKLRNQMREMKYPERDIKKVLSTLSQDIPVLAKSADEEGRSIPSELEVTRNNEGNLAFLKFEKRRPQGQLELSAAKECDYEFIEIHSPRILKTYV